MIRAGLRSRRWGYGAAGWAAVFAILHLYWALGGSVGLAESAGDRLAAERPTAFVLGELYGVAALLAAAAALGLTLASTGGRLTGRLRLLPLLVHRTREGPADHDGPRGPPAALGAQPRQSYSSRRTASPEP